MITPARPSPPCLPARLPLPTGPAVAALPARLALLRAGLALYLLES